MNCRLAPIAVVLCLVLACCASGGTPSPSTRPTAEERYAATAKTTAVGDVLAGGRLRIADTQTLGDGRNSLGCTVVVENISGKHITGRCLVRWFEKDGCEAVVSAPKWQQLNLAPSARAELSSIAPVPWCAGFAIDFVVSK